MKRTFMKFLPFAAAILFATSCSKDGNDDSNVVIDNPVSNQPAQEVVSNSVNTISFSITVNKNTLSKATLQAEDDLTQVFEDGDYLEILTGGDPVTLTLASGAGEADATFSNDNIPENALVQGEDYLVVLKHEERDGYGEPLTEVKADATTLKEAFEKYGYLTSTLHYDGKSSATIELVQNTAFIKVNLPFHGAELTIDLPGSSSSSDVFLSGNEILAVPNGTALSSAILGISIKTIDVLTPNSSGKYTVVYNIKNRSIPDNCIAGVFSVSKGKQVFFSKGNLQYDSENTQWSFADKQYGYVGTGDGNKNGGNGTRDLFCWGAWLTGANPMVSSGTGTTYDWNGNPCAIGSEWRNFTIDELKYLFEERETKGGSRFVKAQITVGDKAINGLILYPDDWSGHKTNDNNKTGSFADTQISEAEWTNMEKAGVVFFPAAGCRKEDGNIPRVNGGIHLWTSTPSSRQNDYAYYFDCNDDPYYSLGDFFRFHGFSVRLIHE